MRVDSLPLLLVRDKLLQRRVTVMSAEDYEAMMKMVRSGNVHRHDKGRAYLANYWTFMDFPGWAIKSIHFWFPIAFVPERKLERILGKDSQLPRMLLKSFFTVGGPSLT